MASVLTPDGLDLSASPAAQLAAAPTVADQVRVACALVAAAAGAESSPAAIETEVTPAAVRAVLARHDVAASRSSKSHLNQVVLEWRRHAVADQVAGTAPATVRATRRAPEAPTARETPAPAAPTAGDPNPVPSPGDVPAPSAAETTGGLPRLTPEQVQDLEAQMAAIITQQPVPPAVAGAGDSPAAVRPQPDQPDSQLAAPAAVPAPRLVARPGGGQHRHDTRPPAGRTVAWLAFLVGGLVSVAANVAHTLYPTALQLAAWTAAGHTVESWRPPAGAMIGAAFWPVALILAVEVLTRVSWREGWWYGAARYGGTGLVAAVAAVMSYRHMAGLLALWGEDALGAHIGPLAVDGLMVVAAAALLTTTRPRTTTEQHQ